MYRANRRAITHLTALDRIIELIGCELDDLAQSFSLFRLIFSRPGHEFELSSPRGVSVRATKKYPPIELTQYYEADAHSASISRTLARDVTISISPRLLFPRTRAGFGSRD